MLSFFDSARRAVDIAFALVTKRSPQAIPLESVRGDMPQQRAKSAALRVAMAAATLGMAVAPAVSWASTGCDRINQGALDFSFSANGYSGSVATVPPGDVVKSPSINGSDYYRFLLLSSYTAGDRLTVTVTLNGSTTGSDPNLSANVFRDTNGGGAIYWNSGGTWVTDGTGVLGKRYRQTRGQFTIDLDVTGTYNVGAELSNYGGGGAGQTSSIQVRCTSLATPTAADKAQAANFNYGTPVTTTTVDLSGSVTNATKVRPATAPGHGTLNVTTGTDAAGTTLIYTPTAGYRGQDTFTYSAVSGSTLSAAKTVTLTVAPPSIVAAVDGSGATAGNALTNYRIVATGAYGSYTCANGSTAPPSNVTINSDCTLSGAPAAAGSQAFSVNVTDSSVDASNANYTATNLPVTLLVLTQPTVSLSANPVSPSTLGTPVTFTAAVTGASPTGNVTFKDNGTNIANCIAVPLSSGQATCTPSSLTAGTHPITATYNGDANNATATSGTLNQVVRSSDSTLSALTTSAGAVNETVAPATTSYTQTVNYTVTAITVTPTKNQTDATIEVNGGSGFATVNSGTASASIPLAVGSNSIAIRVTAQDTTTTTYTLVVTRTAQPTIAISNPATGSTITSGNVTVGGTAGNGATSVTLTLGATNYGPIAVTAGAWSYALPSTLTNGSYAISGVSTDGTATSTTATTNFTVARSTSTATLTAPAAIVAGNNASYTVAVSGSSPTGTVTFIDGATAICSNVPLASGSASCTHTNPAAGDHSITATYSGDASNDPSAASAVTQTVYPALTTTPASSPVTGNVGTAVSGTPVTAAGGVGAITYSLGAAPSWLTINPTTGALDGVPTAPVSTSVAVIATDSTPGTNQTSTKSFTLTISAATSGITLATPAAIVIGSPTTYNASVTGVSPTGTVAFLDGGTPITSCGSQNLSGGSASCTTTPASTGNHIITATYSGDTNNATSTTATSVTQTVHPALTSTLALATITGNVGTTVSGTPVTAAGGVGAITYSLGTAPTWLTINPNTGALGGVPTAPVSTSVTVTATDSTPGTHQTSAQSFTLTISAATSSISLATPSAVVQGSSTSYTATVTGSAPTGTVAFFDGGSAIGGCGSVPLSSGTATCNTTAATAGTRTITATYSGDANNAGSTATGVSQTVYALLATAQDHGSVSGAVGVQLTPVIPVSATGGQGTLTYSLSAPLPSGLNFDFGIGEISGKPTVALTATVFTVTVTDQTPGGAQSSSKTFSLTVSAGTQAITFAALPDAALSASLPALSATSSSTLPVAFASTTTAVCTVSGTTLTLIKTGLCSIEASQAGDSNYAAATPVTRSFTVTKGNQTITVNSSPPTPRQVGGAYTPSVAATSGLPVAVTTAGTNVCTASGGVVTYVGAGTCIVQFDQAGDTNWNQAAQAQQSVAVGKGDQSVSFTSAAPTPSVGGMAYIPTATATSGLPITFILDGSSTGCALSGGSVTFPGTGTCVINASQAGDSNYNPATPAQQSFAISAATALGSSINFAPNTLGVGANGTLTVTFTNTNAPSSPAFNVQITAPSLVTRVGGAPGGTCTVGSTSGAGASVQLNGVVVPSGGCTVTFSYTGATAGLTSGFSLGAFTPAGYPSTGSASGNGFSVVPTVTGISPTTGPVSQVVTISGTGFSTTPGNNTVKFGSDTAAVTGASPTSLTVTAPAAGSGSPVVTVTVNGQTSLDNVIYTFIAPPIAANKAGVTVAYDSAGTAIDLAPSITGGPHGSIAVGTAPAHGTTSIAGDIVTYTPTTGYYGPDSFTYTATGAGGTSNVATVDIDVGLPAAPTAADKNGVTVPFNGTGTAIDLSASITGVHSSIAIGVAPAQGTVTVAGDIVTYTPATGYFGADSFTYTATGPGGTSSAATVTISVGNPPAPTVADKNGVAVAYASAGTAIDLSGSITGVHTSIAIGTAPAHGTVTVAGDVVTYTPTAGYFGSDSFTYTATGPGGTSAAAAVNLTVATPAAPVAADRTGVAVPYAGTGTAIDLSSSITGVHSSIAIGRAPAHGTVTVAGDVVTYTPAAGYFGADSFTYAATGPGGTSNVATVTLNVATPAAPAAANKSGVAVPYASSGTAIDLSGSITGVHSSITIGTAPAHGTVTVAGDVVTYTPVATYFGADSFTYTSTGPGGTSAPATVSLTVATPAAPVAANAAAAVTYNSAGTAIDLAPSITGVHSSIAIGTAPAHGTVTVAGDVVTYTPTAGYFGSDSFTYAATGPGGTSSAATIGVTVATPPAPVATGKAGVAVPYNSAGMAIDLSGAIGGVHTSIAVATQPAHGTVTVAGDVVTYTPAAGYFGADSFTYAATGPGGTSNAATVTLNVATPAAPAATGKAGVAVPYASSGTAIDLSASITGVHSSIAIGTAPAHGTVTVAGDVVTYTPVATYFGTDSFTYTATGPGGTSAPATVSVTVATPAAPIAANAAAAVTYNSAGTAIDLAPSITGVHSSIAIGTAPAHGTATIAGDVVTYTPTAGYFGADSFTYAATGPGGTSSAATVTITVGNPPAPTVADKSGVAVAYDSSGTAIDLSGSITGVHTSIAIGTAPLHGTVTVAGDVVTYTPTAGYFGTDSFTYAATGPGGTSASATVSLNVATPAAPVAANKSGVAIGYNSTGTAIDLAPSITGVHNLVQIGTQPAHGTAAIAGDVVTYTPAANYYGADSFTYMATGPGGTSNAATVSVTVANPPPPTQTPGTGSVAGSSSVNANTSVDINLSALVSGEYSSILIETPPAHGTVTLSTIGGTGSRSAGGQGALAVARTIATYRPAAGFAGTDSFTFYATGPGGRSAAAAVSVTVVGSVPVAAAKTAAAGDGETVSVELTAGATEGPFTGAAVVTVAPANSATTRIVDSGSGASRSFRLEVTPNARFAGNVVVGYTLTNAYGTSAPATVTVAVTARPNPTADANVRGISDAQAETTRRFARSQVSNFMRRTEQLHGGGGQGAEMGVTLNSRDGRGYVRQSPAFDASALEITERMRPSANDPAMGRVANMRDRGGLRADMLGSGAMAITGPAAAPHRNGAVAGAVERPALSEDGDGAGSGERQKGSVAIWSGGAIDIGTQDQTTQRAKITATTAGLSAGADVKIADGVIVGIGGGYGNDVSHIGGSAARVRSTSSLFAAYASVSPGDAAFIDGMIGIGDLSFSTRRAVATLNVNAIGSRDGRFTVGALAAGIDRQSETLRWSLYGRGEFMNADLNAYTETGAGRMNLRFDARDVSSLTGTLGARIEFTGKTGFATITPRLRAEWNHEFADTDAQLLDYADIPGAALYSLATQGWSRDQFQLSAGARFQFERRWSFDVEAGYRGGSGQQAGTLRLQLSKEF